MSLWAVSEKKKSVNHIMLCTFASLAREENWKEIV